MNKYYAGIGSRTSPKKVLKLMTEIALRLNTQGYILRSGGADGADKVFEAGAGTKKEIFRPHHATPKAIKLAMSVHPNPNACKDFVKKLHGRNSQIILGQALDTPVEFVIAWTPGAKLVGGAALGIRLAIKNNITVYNLANEKGIDGLYKKIGIK